MIKSTLLFLLIIATTTIQAQDYMISFAGSGASATVDSIRVENLSQGTSLTVYSGNQLQLLGILSAVDPGAAINGRSLTVYPNPGNGEVVLTFEAKTNAATTIKLSDLAGREVAKTEVFLASGHQSLRICGLNSGTYVIQVSSEGYHYSGKIICRSNSPNPLQIIYLGPFYSHLATENLKQTEAVVQMQYNTGDLLKFTGRSGNFGTIYMDIPDVSKTITFNFVPCTDYDNNHYTVVQIGEQIWMAENLKTTKFSNGDEIPEVTDASQWNGLSTGAFCYFNNDPENAMVYGCLYNWYASIDNRNACPTNWHVPSDDEWITLTSHLGGEAVAGGKMKETGIEHWFSPNAGATNESGLTIIAGGCRSYGYFDFMGYGGSFWSTTPFNSIFAWNRDIFYYNTVANRSGADKKSGLSIRCVKDFGNAIER